MVKNWIVFAIIILPRMEYIEYRIKMKRLPDGQIWHLKQLNPDYLNVYLMTLKNAGK